MNPPGVRPAVAAGVDAVALPGTGAVATPGAGALPTGAAAGAAAGSVRAGGAAGAQRYSRVERWGLYNQATHLTGTPMNGGTSALILRLSSQNSGR